MLLHQMDVTSAFLNGDLQEVYMRQPEGFQVKGKEHIVYKLKQSMYGLKQAWNMTLDHLLKRMGFVQAKSNPCLYITSEGELCIIAVYVDDILIATKDKEKMNDVKSKLSAEFEVKDLGELQYLLERLVWIGQPTYTLNILQKFGLQDAKPVATPMCVSSKLRKATDDDELVDENLYQSAIGSLQYLSTMTRPDITFAVSNVAKYSSKPTKEHWVAVKRIMRYLKGTHNLGLIYRKSDFNGCIGFSDCDWAVI
uniref:Reverse transcriptase Ty1/copia-type domain-containing protein n=1 Tax=Amphimedon queenslandica TaxID=400682 RepID=A0A1X7UWB4_AMPQE